MTCLMSWDEGSRDSLFTAKFIVSRRARFANFEEFLGFQITTQFAAKTKLRITLDCSK